MKKNLLTGIKFLVSCLLIIFVLRKVDPGSIWQTMKTANPAWLIIAFSLHIPGYLVSALRWQRLLQAQNVSVNISRLILFYLVGTFFNNFFPTAIGGDVMRAYYTSRYTRSKTQAAMIIFVERLTGISVLMIFALLALIIGREFRTNQILVIIVGVFFSLLLLFIFIFFSRFGRGKGEHIFNLPGFRYFRQGAKKIYDSITVYKGENGKLLQVFALSCLLQLIVIIYYYLISRALGFRLSLFSFFFIVPVLHVFLMLPVAINGIGVRENVFIFLLARYGIPAGGAVALSWIAFGIILIYALIGGITFPSLRMIERRDTKD